MFGPPAFPTLMFLLPGTSQRGILQTAGLVAERYGEAQFTAPPRYLRGPEAQTSEGGARRPALNAPHRIYQRFLAE